MRIAIVVHGRFYAFDLALALLQRGHVVRVFTNYPGWATEQFGLSRAHVSSFTLHGILSRAAWKLRARPPRLYLEEKLHRLFSAWAAKQLARDTWDIVYPWSGVAEEILTRRARNTKYLVMRGSTHIRTQAELLAQEQTRTGAPQEQPSAWMIAREEREYARADEIVVLSTFARNSFLERGFDGTRVWNLPLAAPTEQFRPTREIVDARRARILAGEPLRVLYVGALSFRKGMYDFAALARGLDATRIVLRVVGPRSAETEGLWQALGNRVELVSKQAEVDLPQQYAWADVFVFPTIEDGFPLTLAQAQASALPILSTVNCSAPDIVTENETGWLLPIRTADAFVERLRWCDAHRAELGAMVEHIFSGFRLRTYDDVARDFEIICKHAQERPA